MYGRGCLLVYLARTEQFSKLTSILTLFWRLSNDEKIVAGHDVTEQTLKVPHQDGDERVSEIKTVTRHLDGKLILQGAEDGSEQEADAIGWTMSIDEEDGRMIFSASRETAAFVVFGACILY